MEGLARWSSRKERRTSPVSSALMTMSLEPSRAGRLRQHVRFRLANLTSYAHRISYDRALKLGLVPSLAKNVSNPSIAAPLHYLTPSKLRSVSSPSPSVILLLAPIRQTDYCVEPDKVHLSIRSCLIADRTGCESSNVMPLV